MFTGVIDESDISYSDSTVESESGSTADAGQSPAALARRAQEGDTEAFAGLVRRYQGMVYKVVRSQIRGDAAEEVVWDAWYKVWINIPRLRDTGGAGTWIARVARNASIDWLRRQDARQRMEDEMQQRTAVTAPAADQACLHGEMHAALTRAMSALPEDDRWIVHLSYVAGRTSAEIGATMGMPQSTVKWRLLRSKERLREHMTPFA